MAVIKVAHDDPYFKTTWDDGELHKPTIHANVNDSIGVEMASPRLAGRTTTGIGPAEEITVDLPMHLENEHLSIDLSAMQASLDDLQSQINALDTRIDALEANSATSAALENEASIRTTFDNLIVGTTTTISARVDKFESVLPPVVLLTANLTTLGVPTSGFLPADRTCLAFLRDTNKLYVWDPDSSTWIILN